MYMLVNPYLIKAKYLAAATYYRITPKLYGMSAACSRNSWRKKTNAAKTNNRKG